MSSIPIHSHWRLISGEVIRVLDVDWDEWNVLVCVYVENDESGLKRWVGLSEWRGAQMVSP